jgi:hypothetical protein
MDETRQSFPPHPLETGAADAIVSVRREALENGGRRFSLASTAEQRDDGPKTRVLDEAASDPRVVSGNPLFDALFAEAIGDARVNSVSAIRDGAYDEGRPIPAEVFTAGEVWTYVWTRDVAYAIDLGLALIDPERAKNSLLYKVSGFRDGVTVPPELPEDSLQIVQDTGSGGSWPVSTDRVSWALGAEAILATLDEPSRSAFAATALRALAGTIEADRLAAYDPADGLYRGETSFLDWRIQTYAPHVNDDIVLIATAKALSTNVGHLRALRLAARLARDAGDGVRADRYAGWGNELASAIDAGFWRAADGLYASVTTPDSPAVSVGKFDLLGLSLAILAGVADREKARTILTRYPRAPFGPPVVYPEQPDAFVYHNRAIWAFVTAYGLEAAVAAGHVAAADHAFDSLLRAAALYLNNVENQEWLTGRTRFDDGPAISSPRQLWSIGGYLGLVARTVFGYRPGLDGLVVAPFLTTHMRAAIGGDTARLENLVLRGRRLALHLDLPPASILAGVYEIAEVRLNGKAVTGVVAYADLAADNSIEVRFGAVRPDDARLTLVPEVPLRSHDDPAVFSPNEPEISDLVIEGDRVRLAFERRPTASGREDPLLFTVLRDGAVAADGLTEGVFRDPEPLRPGIARRYRVLARYASSGNASHPSLPALIDRGAVTTVGLSGSDVRREDDGRVFIAPTVPAAGRYALELVYVNHSFHIQTGVTCAVKRLTARRPDGEKLATGIVALPHMKPTVPLRASTPLVADLPAGRIEVEISDFFNMSSLTANRTYISPGGASGPFNEADIRALVLTRIG